MALVDHINKGARRIPSGVLYIAGALAAGWYFYLALTGGMGVDPVKALEHRYGELALQLLIAGLAINPLRRFAGINLIKFRRALGLVAFFFLLAHLLVWAILDVQTLGRVWADIVKRPYITIGMVGFALLVPLAVTSNDWSIRKLQAGWRRLHRLVYPAVILGGVHYVMVVKGWQIEPIIYLAVILALLAIRIRRIRARMVAQTG